MAKQAAWERISAMRKPRIERRSGRSACRQRGHIL